MRNIGQEQAKKIIIEGYINILKRWPDEDGMTHYLEELMSDKLNTEQFYNVLINSEEYKERFGFISMPGTNFSNRIEKDDSIVEEVKHSNTAKSIKAEQSNKKSVNIDKSVEIIKTSNIERSLDNNKSTKVNSSTQHVSIIGTNDNITTNDKR